MTGGCENTAKRYAKAVRDRSPPESRESFLTFLPLGFASTSIPVFNRSCGAVRTREPVPPGNNIENKLVKLALTSMNAAANTF